MMRHHISQAWFSELLSTKPSRIVFRRLDFVWEHSQPDLLRILRPLGAADEVIFNVSSFSGPQSGDTVEAVSDDDDHDFSKFLRKGAKDSRGRGHGRRCGPVDSVQHAPDFEVGEEYDSDGDDFKDLFPVRPKPTPTDTPPPDDLQPPRDSSSGSSGTSDGSDSDSSDDQSEPQSDTPIPEPPSIKHLWPNTFARNPALNRVDWDARTKDVWEIGVDGGAASSSYRPPGHVLDLTCFKRSVSDLLIQNPN